MIRENRKLHARQTRLRLSTLALLVALSACNLMPNETARPEIILFKVSPLGTTAGEETNFIWQLSHYDGVSCTLDIDGDGSPDYAPNCEAGQQSHTYSDLGTYQATLTVETGDIQANQRTHVEITALPTPNDSSPVLWRQLADSPIGRHEAFGGFAADGRFYLFGGYSNIRENRFRPTREVHVYDPLNDTWEQRRDMPEGVSHAGMAVDGTTIYYAGGYPEAETALGQIFATQKVWKYDALTDSYTRLPDLPEGGYGGGSLALVDNRLHYFGGSDKSRQDSMRHWVLSPKSPQVWSSAQGLPIPRNHLGTAVLDGKIYAVGGQSGQDRKATYRHDMHRYDPATDTWSRLSNLPIALSHNNGSTFEADGKIVVLGGEPAYGKRVASAFSYDPKTDTWQELTSMILPKSAGAGGYLNGKLYHFTGSVSNDTLEGTFIK